MTPQFQTPLTLTPCADGVTWYLDTDFIYHTAVVEPAGSGGSSTATLNPPPAILAQIVVPASFTTDLASIPRLFWNLLPPFGKYTAAAVIHDWLYRRHLYPRATCDAILLEAMQVCGVNWFQRQLIYRNVRAFGWSAYNHEPASPDFDDQPQNPHNPT